VEHSLKVVALEQQLTVTGCRMFRHLPLFKFVDFVFSHLCI